MNGKMSWAVRFVVERALLAWSIFIVVALAVSWAAGEFSREEQEQALLQQLDHEVDRRSLELMSYTLNGNLMGALSLLGLVDADIKRDGLEGSNAGYAANSLRVSQLLESVAKSHAADGVFVVAGNGVVASSWDSSGKPSTGVGVKFRPYFLNAMQGKASIYAAVSLARGDRALYFASPIYASSLQEGKPLGAIVGRLGVARVDELLRKSADIALLLSPQGVVFAGSKSEWIGHLAGVPTPERLQAIRELKQFGSMFERERPAVLPVSVEDGVHLFEGRRHAVATASVSWNDLSGDWKLVLIEDLSRRVSPAKQARVAAVTALILLLIGGLGFNLLRSHYRQQVAAAQLEVYARAQEAAVCRKQALAAASMKLQQARSPEALGQAFLSQSHVLFGALQGVVYVAAGDADGRLRLAASYACADGGLPEVLLPGEGLLGQCVLDQRSRVVATGNDGFTHIRSGLGGAQPAAIMLGPALLNGVTLALVEIALLTWPDDTASEQFDELLQLLAMNLEIISGAQMIRSSPVVQESEA
ncbi:MAG: hypothetical protein WC023_08145 [Rhodocyclaceae bacterium]